MDIVVSDKLKGYLRKKNINEIVLDLPMRKVCCSGPYIPVVRKIRKNEKVDEYILDEVEGIKIYRNREIKYARKILQLSIRKTFGLVEMYAYDPDNVCVCGGSVKGV